MGKIAHDTADRGATRNRHKVAGSYQEHPGDVVLVWEGEVYASRQKAATTTTARKRGSLLTPMSNREDSMTCVLVAHLGEHVIFAADKRAVQINTDGSRTVLSDDVEKIVETGVGVITGACIVEMLEQVKS